MWFIICAISCRTGVWYSWWCVLDFRISIIYFSLLNIIYNGIQIITYQIILLLHDVVNKHAPLKKHVIKQKQILFINSTLRKQNNVRDRFKRIWLKIKWTKNREAYVMHRNLLTKLRKHSLNKYLKDKCKINNTHNNKEFWKITKHFMSHKGSSANTNIFFYRKLELPLF